MNCQEAMEFLLDYVEGRLEPEVRASFARHLAACPPCVDYLASYEATVVLAREAYREPCGELPPELLAAILRARAAGAGPDADGGGAGGEDA